jgi:hypothetical protein
MNKSVPVNQDSFDEDPTITVPEDVQEYIDDMVEDIGFEKCTRSQNDESLILIRS